MKNTLVALVALIAITSCSDSGPTTYWEFDVVFPDDFEPKGTDLAEKRFWDSKDGTVSIGNVSYTKARSEFRTLSEFADWIGEDSGIVRPMFFRAANGYDVAVDEIQDSTQIAIATNDNQDYWEIVFFGIKHPSDPSSETILLRDRAIAAILSGRFVNPNLATTRRGASTSTSPVPEKPFHNSGPEL